MTSPDGAPHARRSNPLSQSPTSPHARLEARPDAPPVALVADDDAAIREIVRFRLQGLGYSVLEAADGGRALALARDRLPDIALIDVAMPVMSGLDVTRALKAETETAGIPVILLTSRHQAADVAAGYDAGAAEYVTKPFSARELVEAVRRKETERRLQRAEAAAQTLAEERARMLAELDALRRVATEVARRGGTGVFDLVAEEAARLLGAQSGAVFAFRPWAAETVGSWAAEGFERRAVGSPLPYDSRTAVAEVARGRRSSARLDVIRPEGRSPASPVRPWARSALAAAIRVDDATWGALAVVSASPDRFGPDAEDRLAQFVELLEVAVVSAEDKRRLARRVREQEALGRVAAAVAESEDAAAVMRLALREVADASGARGAAVVRLGAGGAAPTVVEAWGTAEGRGPLPPAVARVVAEVARSGAVMRAGPPDDAGAPGDTLVAAPLLRGPAVWGVLHVAAPGVGGDDRPEDLVTPVATLLGVALQNADARRRLAELATTDHLTGLPNRRAFEERLAQEVERARRHGHPLSLALLDLDHFKRVNDEHGHDTGDAVLREASRRLVRLVRGGEVIARVGGEEFAWILAETDAIQALAAAERAGRAVAETPFERVGTVTCSIGVSEQPPGAGVAALFRSADEALYAAKRAGRNRAAVASREAGEA